MTGNVLQLIGSFGEGGSERQAIQLTRLLRERGKYRVELACLDARGPLRDDAMHLGFGEITEFPLTSFHDRNAVKQLRRFVRFLRERDIDVVQTHDFYTNVFGMAGAALARVPVRIAARRETLGWRTAAQKFVEHRAYNLANSIIANAEAVKSQLRKEGVAENKIVTIYNGLDMTRFDSGCELRREDALTLFNLPCEGNLQFVTIVANLRHRVKNHSMFLRAARRISEASPLARFIIAGEGDLASPVKALAAELGLRDKVFFIGRCGRIPELLALSDVCVLSSTGEGFSNSILEYMAAGRAVVATDVGGAREAIADGKTGYLVPSDDDERMASRIVELIQEPDTARAMGRRGRQTIERKFSCDAQLERTQQLYERLLARAREGLPRSAENRPPMTCSAATRRPEDANQNYASMSGSLPKRRPDAAKPVRVLIVAPSLDILGGQAVQANRLLDRLGKEPSLEVSFLPVNPRLPGPFRKLQRIKYVRTIVTSVLYLALLLLRVRQYDVIHVFSASYLSFVIAPTPAILIASLYGKKIVLNYRSGEAEDHLRTWRRTALPVIRLVDEIAVPSGYLVDVFARFGFRARSIFNFVDGDRFRFRERRPLHPVFLSNRNLEPLYNVGCVLRAFAIIQQRFPGARLIAVGDGSERAKLEALAGELHLRNLTFTGRVAPDRMHEYIDAADIYLNGSDIDNMPGSIIEAFSSGVPVVTTEAGGIPYIVSHERTGLMVARGDYKSMAEGAIRLLEDGEFAASLIKSARNQCRRYSWESVRNEWLDLYLGLAPAPRIAQIARAHAAPLEEP